MAVGLQPRWHRAYRAPLHTDTGHHDLTTIAKLTLRDLEGTSNQSPAPPSIDRPDPRSEPGFYAGPTRVGRYMKREGGGLLVGPGTWPDSLSMAVVLTRGLTVTLGLERITSEFNPEHGRYNFDILSPTGADGFVQPK